MTENPPEIHRWPEQFLSDDRRVITRPHLPGGGEKRLRHLLERVRMLDEQTVQKKLDEVLADFAQRHRRLEDVFDDHFDLVAIHLDPDASLTTERKRLIGAYVTMEYSIEAAALFNPSIVPHFDQSDVASDACRFIMSLRATGEGHISSIVFRTGVVEASGRLTVNPASRFVASAKPDPNAKFDKKTFFYKLIEMGAYSDTVSDLLDRMPDEFSIRQLNDAIAEMRQSRTPPADLNFAAERIMWLARSNYTLQFPADCPLSEVVIFPVTENESRGIEDARFVRFVDDDGQVTYYGTYTAYNGFQILPQLLCTQDFRRFEIVTLNGRYAQNKGMALFPRKINKRFVMISRQDGENLHIMTSTNIRFWNDLQFLRGPTYPWELVQIGNCGSPLETEKGWLLLMHGVGPMRRYSIGAYLLDRDDPSKVIAHTREPILVPNDREREGYVPNVVYSCGAMIHNGLLVMPYAMSDSATSFATMELDALLSYMLG